MIPKAREIIYGKEARDKFKTGVDKLANAVKATLGPKGKNVILVRSFGLPTVTKDGVTVAREIFLEDKVENAGAMLVRDVASRTNDRVGDGTTTSTILAQEIISLGYQKLEDNPDIDVHRFREGMNAHVDSLCVELDKMAIPVKSDSDLVKRVATISANNDEELGTTIADLVKKIGNDGVITVSETQKLGIETEHVEGMRFDNGWISPYMVTEPARMEAEYKDTPIIVTDGILSEPMQVASLMKMLKEAGISKAVLIVNGLEGDALSTVVQNRLNGAFNMLAIRAPGFGENRIESLKDICAITGAQLISQTNGTTLEKLEQDQLGRADSIVATKDRTTIIGGRGDKGDIDERVGELRALIDNDETPDYDKTLYRERLAKLVGGIALIKVGAPTEAELHEKKYLIEDAIAATQAALEEGIVAGGGSALLAAGIAEGEGESIDESYDIGWNLIDHILMTPFNIISNNAGAINNLDNVLDKIADKETSNAGYDAKNGVIIDNMIEAGIIDPVKVTKSALRNAVSAAAMFLTTEAVVVEIDDPEEKK